MTKEQLISMYFRGNILILFLSLWSKVINLKIGNFYI